MRSNPEVSVKKYWTISKTFCSSKKIPLIPPQLINDRLMTGFHERASSFNSYFPKQCTLIENYNSILTETNCLCDAKISVVDFDNQDVLKILRALDINKAHGHDNIPTRMMKLFNSAIVNHFQ